MPDALLAMLVRRDILTAFDERFPGLPDIAHPGSDKVLVNTHVPITDEALLDPFVTLR
jgi:hypothetical protein